MTNLEPDLHGRPLTKHPTELYKWLLQLHRQRTAAAANGSDPLALPARSPIPSCHFYVDHNSKTIYVRTSKVRG